MRDYDYVEQTIPRLRGHILTPAEIMRTRKLSKKLIRTEKKFGYSNGLKRRRVSSMDPRSSFEINQGGMIGGDRMSSKYHGYAKIYAKYLNKLYYRKLLKINILEIGVLKGTGLALWSQIFPSADIIGLDIDLSYYYENKQNLTELGAFIEHEPTVLEFDQYQPTFGSATIPKLDLIIDDGVHTSKAVRLTFDFLITNDYVARDSTTLYFIEDNAEEYLNIAKEYKELKVSNYGEITVINGFENLRAFKDHA